MLAKKVIKLVLCWNKKKILKIEEDYGKKMCILRQRKNQRRP